MSADDESDDGVSEGGELEAEKQKSLSVLEGIVGSRAMHSVKNKTTANFRQGRTRVVTAALRAALLGSKLILSW